MAKSLPARAWNMRDAGSVPGLGRSPRGGDGNPLQYPCLGNPTDRGAMSYGPWGHKELDVTEHTHTDTHRHTRALGAAGGLHKEQQWDKAGLRERAEVTKGRFLVTEASPGSSPVNSNKKCFKKGERSSSKFLFR